MQAGVSELAGTMHDIKHLYSDITDGDTVWRRAMMVCTEGIVQGLSNVSKPTGKGYYRHAPVRPGGGGSTEGRSSTSGLTVKQQTEEIQPKTPSSNKNSAHEGRPTSHHAKRRGAGLARKTARGG